MKDSSWHRGGLEILTLNLAIRAAAAEFQSVRRWPGLFPGLNSTSPGSKRFKMLTRLWCTRLLVELQRTQLAHTTQMSWKASAMWQTSRPLTLELSPRCCYIFSLLPWQCIFLYKLLLFLLLSAFLCPVPGSRTQEPRNPFLVARRPNIWSISRIHIWEAWNSFATAIRGVYYYQVFILCKALNQISYIFLILVA